MKKAFLVGLEALLLCVFWQAGCGDSSDSGEDGSSTDECGDRKPAIFPVINGVTEPNPDIVNLTFSQQNAVGAILINGTQASCTATLVAPNVVVAAAHCIDPGTLGSPVTSVRFVGGPDIWPPDFTFAAYEWHMHPDWRGRVPEGDLSVILINGDTLGAGITPIPVNLETTRLVGKTVQAVGYGDTRTGGYNTQRWWTTLFVSHEAVNYYTTYGNGMTGMCQGDSGSPLLYTRGDGNVYVMAALSGGDAENCLGHDYYARTDYYGDFLKDYVPYDACDGETLQGRCEGATAVWCEAETVMTEDCAAVGYVCMQSTEGNFRCMDEPDPCEGETFEGRCDGNTAIWCEAETVNTWPCPEGSVCGNLGDGLHRCVDECMLIGPEGRCDENNVARWCEDGAIRIRDCTACGQLCGWADETLGYYCI
ncbi:MAG: trypsin-like serine protease [Pseudomonadota bacterium]